MCCAIEALLKFVITIINVVLGIGFLLIALFGILLKSSANFVTFILNKALSYGSSIEDEQAKQLTDFVLNHSSGVSIIFIVIGLVLAGVCFVGAFAACCVCGILLKIYAVILVVLLVAQIIAVAVVFSNPEKLAQDCIDVMTKMLGYFGQDSDMGKASTVMWEFTMTFNGSCCGINGANDFKTFANLTNPPAPCCPSSKPVCTYEEASAPDVTVPGCKTRINNFLSHHLRMIMYVAIAAIVLQAILLIVVGLAIFL